MVAGLSVAKLSTELYAVRANLPDGRSFTYRYCYATLAEARTALRSIAKTPRPTSDWLSSSATRRALLNPPTTKVEW
jgi:hypothetical protein